MSTVLFNPTNEQFEAQYIGETTIIPAGAKIKVDDNRARHILNTLGARGLMTLDYGDEGEKEETKAAVGRRRNHDFKRKQVLRFNQQNESRQASKLPYQEPSSQIAQYADEVGIPLLQPYRPESESSEKIARLTRDLEDKSAESKAKDEEIKAMRAEMSELKDTMGTFMKMMKDGSAKSEPHKTRKKTRAKKAEKKPDNDTDEQNDVSDVIINQFAGLSKNKFQDWVFQNGASIPTYPDKVKERINSMWKKYFEEDFPEDIITAKQK